MDKRLPHVLVPVKIDPHCREHFLHRVLLIFKHDLLERRQPIRHRGDRAGEQHQAFVFETAAQHILARLEDKLPCAALQRRRNALHLQAFRIVFEIIQLQVKLIFILAHKSVVYLFIRFGIFHIAALVSKLHRGVPLHLRGMLGPVP